ncbi:hypothetical protein LCGC14_0678320 [marine sediment metagenome]|uniref:Holin n=2 Tax=root TaxID=1 RepID=A0A9C9NJP6_9HYPH|nr:hypothetical protein [Aurantimonas coralicida]
MWKAIRGILSSKKAVVAAVSAAVWIAGRFGLELDVAELLPVVAPLWAYVIGQGVADAGKERAKVEAGTD